MWKMYQASFQNALLLFWEKQLQTTLECLKQFEMNQWAFTFWNSSQKWWEALYTSNKFQIWRIWVFTQSFGVFHWSLFLFLLLSKLAVAMSLQLSHFTGRMVQNAKLNWGKFRQGDFCRLQRRHPWPEPKHQSVVIIHALSMLNKK